MTAETRHITDKSLFGGIFDGVFMKKNVFMKTRDLNIQVESFAYREGRLVVRVGEAGGDIGKPLFYVRNNEEVVLAHAALVSRDGDGSYTFDPLDVQVMQMPRKEERRRVAPPEQEGGEAACVSNIVSDFFLKDSLANNTKKVEFLRSGILKKIESAYPGSRLFFFNEKPADARMEYFKKERAPFFIRNTEDREGLSGSPAGVYYLSHIMTHDPVGRDGKIISEIAVPLLYRLMLPFGYIQAGSTAGLADDDYMMLKKLGMSISTLFTGDRQMVKGSEERIAVTDLSESGMGIFFRERTLIRYFKEGSSIVLTFFLPGGKQANMLAAVRNIAILKNSVYRVGCEILYMESIGEVHYTEYLEVLGKAAAQG